MNYCNLYSTSNSVYGSQVVTRQQKQQIIQQEQPSPKLGLENIGNTCYINVILQCLYHIPMVTVKLKQLLNENIMGSSKLFQQFYSIWFKLTQARVKVDTNDLVLFKQLIAQQYEHFDNVNQHDCIEFIQVFMDLISKDCVFRNQGPLNFMHQLFQGQIVYSITCSNCKNDKSIYENFINLSLYIHNQTISINGALFDYFKQETMTSQENCNKCKKKCDLIKRSQFQQLPEVLIIHLKRYDQVQNKQQKQLNIDQSLKMNSQANKPCSYRLFSVVNHQGQSVHSGHYTCLIKQSTNWLHYNDLRVSEYSNKVVDDELNKSINSYVLFYLKI